MFWTNKVLYKSCLDFHGVHSKNNLFYGLLLVLATIDTDGGAVDGYQTGTLFVFNASLTFKGVFV